MASRRVKITETVLSEVKRLASNGLTRTVVAATFGYSSWRNFTDCEHVESLNASYIVGVGSHAAPSIVATGLRALDDDRPDCSSNAHFIINRSDRLTVIDTDDAGSAIDDRDNTDDVTIEEAALQILVDIGVK